jgi:GntR family transcriptional regulator of arabinose operon
MSHKQTEHPPEPKEVKRRIRTKATYLDIEADLRARLSSNKFPPGSMLPGRRELAVEYGVAVGTLERALNKLITDGLLFAYHGRGTFVGGDPIEPTKRTGFIGFLGEGLTNAAGAPYWGKVVSGIQEVARREDRQVVLLDEHSYNGWSDVDGVLVSDPRVEDQVRESPVSPPFISLITPMIGMPGVIADDFQGGRDATDYLLTLGHTKIASLDIKGANPVTARRRAGFEAAYRRHKLQYDSAWDYRLNPYFSFYTYDFRAAGYAAMKEWIAGNWNELGCTAILVHNDNTAIGVIEAFEEAGIDVPGDVSVIGYDGAGVVGYNTEHITTIEVPLREIGFMAMVLLLQQIAEENTQVNPIILPTRLRIGKTTAAPQSKSGDNYPLM